MSSSFFVRYIISLANDDLSEAEPIIGVINDKLKRLQVSFTNSEIPSAGVYYDIAKTIEDIISAKKELISLKEILDRELP
jgi:hypothetical protein